MRRLASHALVRLVAGWAAPAQAHQPRPSPHANPATPSGAVIRQAAALLERRDAVGAERLLTALLQRPDLGTADRPRASRLMGEACSAQGRSADAARAFGTALEAAIAAEDRREAGWARRWAAVTQYADGHGAEARGLWNAALDDFRAVGDGEGECEVLDDLASATTGLDRRPYVERCLAIAEALRDERLEGRARARWAHGLLEAARPGPALTEVDRGVSLLRPLGARARGDLAAALSTLGWALRAHGSNARAVPVHREAIRLARAAGDVDGLVWNYFGLGVALIELGRFDEADTALRRSREAAARTGSQTTIRIVSESAGYLAMRRGDWRRAVPALEASAAAPGVDVTAMPLVNLAKAYRRAGRPTDALSTAARAVAVARRLGAEDNELHALTELAEANAALGDLTAAETTLRQVTDRLERYRASLAPVDFLKQGFGDRFADAYGLTIRVLMDQGRPGDALAAAERVKARAFADLLLARRVRERERADTARWLLGGSARDDAAAGPLDSPAAAPPLDAPALGVLAASLSATVVAYWIHESGSYVWVVGQDAQVHGARLAIRPATLARQIARAAVPPEIQLENEASAKAPGREIYSLLYRELWAPIEQWLPSAAGSRVTIIPHGPLFACPFSALRDVRGRYLVERHALHYVASGSVLEEALARRAASPPAQPRALLVADPAQRLPSHAPDPGALPAARLEVRQIERALPMQVVRLEGSRASERGVRGLMTAARVVHFATHALVTESDPLGSHLVLSGAAGPRSEDDGRLTASEIAGMRLAAGLVVLSACRSARGAVSSDGIAGLTRAFMVAGAPTVVATLWDVNDDVTSAVMPRLYRARASGLGTDAALRAAQLEVLRELRAGRLTARRGGMTIAYPEHPWLWAAPVVVGAP